MRMFFIKLAVVIVAAGFVLVGCPNSTDPDDVPVTGVSLSTRALTMGPNATATLTATVNPADATDKGVSWSSNAENVATVSEGTVTAKAAGTATITVTTNDGGFTDTCTVTVDPNQQGVAVSEVRLSETSKTLDVGGTFTLTPVVVPTEAGTDKTVTWSSDNTDVATVDEGTGKVTAVAIGSARITATLDGKSAVCTVTVNDPAAKVEDLLATGIANLKGGYFDGALTSFEAAFAKDVKGSATYTESVVYSSLAKLASLVKDQNFRKLLSDHTGVTGYPDSIDELLSGKWMEDYTDEDLVWSYYDDAGQWVSWRDAKDTYFFTNYNLTPQSGYYYSESSYDTETESYTYKLSSTEPKYEADAQLLPGLPVPAWFNNTNAYKDSLSVNGFKTPGTWELLLMANLVDKNSSGLNSLLDDVLSSVFGTAFEDAVARASLISYDDSFKVTEDILNLLGVRELFEGDVNIGKAELDLLFSAMRVLKASLQWVSAYDWDTDVSFLKTEWYDLDINNLNPANLPFRNNFLKDRNNGRMAQAKESYITAINTAIAAYDSMIAANSHLPAGAVDVLKEFGWIKDGLSKLKTAIKDGGTFYVQEGSGSTYSNSQAGAMFGVNLGKFFTPGQFAIDKLISTEGSAPKFFGMKDGQDGTAITAKDQIKQYGMLGFELTFAPLKEVVVYGFEFPADGAIPLFPPDIAEHLYGLYH